MARVTVEDCVEIVPNRFELVVVASERAKNITAGSSPTVERDNDKNAVIALREIAERTVNVDVLREAVIQQNQRYANFEPEIIDEDNNSTELSSDLIDEVKAFSHQSDQPSQDSDSSVDGETFSFSEDNLDVDD
ncbi:MAG: DNA-directed RNA polymerase subunit omega [Rickettsiales bacterium]|nr:DNA-directed RNA polymerase subunit omega [Rickettsiales bacterium]